MKIKYYSLISIAILFVLVLSGCSQSMHIQSKSLSKEGGTLIIGMESDADLLDPQRAGGWVTMRVNNQMFEPLVGEDLSKSSKDAPVPELIPVLAKSWDKSADGKTYTFHLRENVKFHDGTPFNADAVNFNIRRLTDKGFEFYDKLGAGKTIRTFKYYDKTEVVDEYTIKIMLKEPFADFPRMLAQINSLQIVSPAAVKKYGNNEFGNHPSGTGPFVFKDRKRGEQITLVRNEQYWGKKAYLDKVIFRPLSDSSGRVLALQNDDVDIIAVPPPDAISNFKKQGFNVITGTPPHVWYLSFNFDNDIMKNQKVRQAINYAIDRKGLAKYLLRDTATPAYTMLSPGSSIYDPNEKAYEYNPEKAKELLKEAGYEKGFQTILQTSVDGSGQLLPVDMAEWIQRDLGKVGITVTLKTQEWITYLAKYNDGMAKEVGMNQMSSGRTTPFFLAMVAHSKYSAPGGFNSGKYVNKELDKKMDLAATSVDESKANELWKEADKMITEDAAFAPIVNDTAPYVVNKRVQDFVVPAEEWYTLAPVWIKK